MTRTFKDGRRLLVVECRRDWRWAKSWNTLWRRVYYWVRLPFLFVGWYRSPEDVRSKNHV